MEQKTKLRADDGSQDIVLIRDFDLPVEWLFEAYVTPDIVAQWMGTQVLKLECRQHGSYRFETTDPRGNKHGFSGVIHDFVPNQKITRTFEMEGTPYPAQLEFLEFEKLGEDTSRLTMHVVYRSADYRNQILQLPFAHGINRAHDRLQEVVLKVK